MLHDRSNVTGKITVIFEAEDWVWLCRVLAEALRTGGLGNYELEDMSYLLDVLEAAEAGE